MISPPLEFRAWDVDQKRWLTAFVIRPDGFMIFNASETVGKGVLVTQFTGHKDKNGKKEFCGDILLMKVVNEFGSYQDIYAEINWNQARMCFTALDKMPYNFEVVEEEVVGNVFEQPELRDKTRFAIQVAEPHGEEKHQ